mgnify:CR=1 FL=1
MSDALLLRVDGDGDESVGLAGEVGRGEGQDALAGVELLDVGAPFAADAWRVVKGGYEALGLEEITNGAQRPADEFLPHSCAYPS